MSGEDGARARNGGASYPSGAAAECGGASYDGPEGGASVLPRSREEMLAALMGPLPQVALAASPAEDREPVDASSWLFPWAP